MIKFSVKNQAFYDLTLNYPKLPDDLIEITAEQHNELLDAINSGCIVFDDLTVSELKPSQFHTWNGTEWIDNRTPEQLAEYNRTQMPTLTPIEFDIKLNNAGLYDVVQELIKDSFELRIAYNRATFFSRLNPFIIQATEALGLTPEQVDEIWTA